MTLCWHDDSNLGLHVPCLHMSDCNHTRNLRPVHHISWLTSIHGNTTYLRAFRPVKLAAQAGQALDTHRHPQLSHAGTRPPAHKESAGRLLSRDLLLLVLVVVAELHKEVTPVSCMAAAYAEGAGQGCRLRQSQSQAHGGMPCRCGREKVQAQVLLHTQQCLHAANSKHQTTSARGVTAAAPSFAVKNMHVSTGRLPQAQPQETHCAVMSGYAGLVQ
jgi:hypothetical protein